MAWLIAKLYAFRQIPHSPGDTLAYQLGKCQPNKDKKEKERFAKTFDGMLSLPLDKIELDMQWALDLLDSRNLKLDWVELTNDLSIWERESVRLKWAEQFLRINKRRQSC